MKIKHELLTLTLASFLLSLTFSFGISYYFPIVKPLSSTITALICLAVISSLIIRQFFIKIYKIHHTILQSTSDKCKNELQHIDLEIKSIINKLNDYQNKLLSKDYEMNSLIVTKQNEIESLKSENHLLRQDSEKIPTTNPIFIVDKILYKNLLGQHIKRSKRFDAKFALLFINIDIKTNSSDKSIRSIEPDDKSYKQIEKIIQHNLRGDDLLAKIDQATYAITLNEIRHRKFAGKIASKLIQQLLSLNSENQTSPFNINVGIAIYPDDGNEIDTLLMNANKALYQSKLKEINHYRYTSDALQIEATEYQSLEASLRKAIQSNNLMIYYQPKFEVKSGLIIGVEALMRWNHPDLGYIQPNRFIEIAEQTGQIISLTAWQVDEVCRIMKMWQDLGYQHLTLSLKISSSQFYHSKLTNIIKESLSKTGLHSKYLELVIDEEALNSNKKLALKKLHELRYLGILISIDHYGRGATSISFLKEFPFSSIKIDTQYIKGIPEQLNDKSIVRAIIALAHELGLKVVAEGVESADQVEFLSNQQCDILQGYFLSQPLPHENIQEQLKKIRDHVLF